MEASTLSFSPLSLVDWQHLSDLLLGLYSGDYSVCNCPSVPYRVPRTGNPQELPQNLLLTGSLSSFLSLASGLVGYIYGLPCGWAHPDCWPSGSGFEIQLFPKIVLSSTLGSSLCSIHPTLKMMPQFHEQTSSLDRRTWVPLCLGREI